MADKPIKLNIGAENEPVELTKEVAIPSEVKTEFFTDTEKEKIRKEFLEEIEREDKKLTVAPIQKSAIAVEPLMVKSQNLIQIEKILEDDLQEVYFKLEPATREKFKTKGEQTAWQIEQILNSTRVKAKKIFSLILDWLKLIPGVNKFFIRQEAKIKTEKIIQLKDNE
ncbi:MAG: hypothetical protein HY979_01405 [Candidatus Magasanikbacteria bacterium]|nr:hypothetical protein [Candidatus Magasanikbacteria bacterium]